MNQKALLRIVQTWEINEKPEYRGSRCANCQKYVYKAWHHWLKEGSYRTPVHFCNDCEAKFKFKSKGIYKTFSCDNCGKNIRKAYHVWTNKDGVLSETHFCKKCGDKLGLNRAEIKGIIYDLDGTIVSTINLHEAGWICAGKKFNIPISCEMLLNQSGISNEAAAKMILPNDKKYLIKKFIAAKVKYVMENVNRATLFPGILKVMEQLLQKGHSVWICTSAPKNFVKKILNIFKALKKIKNNIVWREMYKKEKPSPDMLNLTIKQMSLSKKQVFYIGDAFSDYKLSKRAEVKFVYFCPNLKKRDLRIPKSIPIISLHKKIFKLLK